MGVSSRVLLGIPALLVVVGIIAFLLIRGSSNKR